MRIADPTPEHVYEDALRWLEKRKVPMPLCAAHAPLAAAIMAAPTGLPPDVKAFLFELLETAGPAAVKLAVGFLEARFPLYTPYLEFIKAEVLRLIPVTA